MKWRDPLDTWLVVFAGGRTDRIRADTPEKAAAQIAMAYFGRLTKVRRITGPRGDCGTFEAIRRGGGPVTVFDVARPEVAPA